MLSKHPLELPPGRRLSKEEVADALRLAIIAELDAISLYLQLARSIDDEKVRRVFEDIAREEKTHVGEFLALLKSMDPEQVAELEKGAKEVEELTGLRAPDGGQGAGGPAKAELRLEEAVASRVKEAVASARTVARRLPSVTAGRGVEAVPVESVAEGRSVLPLKELSFRFRVSQKAVDYAVATNSLLEAPEGLKAAYTLAQEEDRLVASTLLEKGGARLEIGGWETPGQAPADVARAVAHLAGKGLPRPYVLFLNPADYARLLSVSEKTGVTDLERVKALVDDVAATPSLPEGKGILVSAAQGVVDVVYGGNAEVDYVGPEDGYHVFRVWSSLALRLKNPEGVVVLERKAA